MSRGASNELDAYPFVKLAQSRLPPRMRGLLEGAYQAAQPIIDSALSRALDELDRDLLAHTERGTNVSEQNQCFASLREFRLRRADFMQACRAGVQRSMLALIDPSVPDETLQVVTVRDSRIAPDAPDAATREEDLTLSQIATRAEIRAGLELQALAYRFGVIAGSAPIDIEQLVLGPYKLCAAIRSAARRFEVFSAHRLALYRRIDKTLFAEPDGLYQAVNRYLIDHRVFAHLQLSMASEDGSEGAVAGAAPAVAPAAAATAVEAPPAAPRGTGAVDAPIAAAPVDAPPSRPTPASAGPGASAEVAPSARGSMPLPAATTPDRPMPAPAAAAELPLDANFFRILRERLAADRIALRGADAGVESGRPLADRRELQQALSVLQAQSPAPIMVAGKWANRSVAHIKQDLMNQLRSVGDGGPPKLRDEDSDAIDMVGLLFGQLLAAYRPNSMSHALVSRLQIPLLKVALRDPGFFTRRAHPARRFLNTTIECIADWIDDEDADRHVIEKLQMVVDRLIREFDDDIGCFDRCLDDLEKHVGSLQRKAEVAERRHVEAAKGREKLDLARAAAFEAVQQQIRGSVAPFAISNLLERAWADAIALSLLRQGVDHPKTRERIALVGQLLAVFAAGRGADSRRAALDRLRPAIEDGLAAVGFHDDAIASAWNDICELVDARNDQQQQAAANAISELIRQKPRFGGDAANVTAGTDHPQGLLDSDDSALDPSEREMAERIRQLPFGTWFEFTVNRNGDVNRRRLSWLSQVTGRCMFLTARGAKCDDRSIGQLAREMLHGTARIAAEDRDQPVDRAWQAIRSALRDARARTAPAQTPPTH